MFSNTGLKFYSRAPVPDINISAGENNMISLLDPLRVLGTFWKSLKAATIQPCNQKVSSDIITLPFGRDRY